MVGSNTTEGFFDDNNYERFIRLVVREGDKSAAGDGTLRDSNIGTDWGNRVATNTIEGVDYENLSTIGNPSPFNYTRVPIDFNESISFLYTLCVIDNSCLNKLSS